MLRKINEYDRVNVIKDGVKGTVVDVFYSNGKRIFIVESNIKTYDSQGDWEYKLYYCEENDLKLLT